MATNTLTINDVLDDSRRFGPARSDTAIARWEIAALLGIGGLAAAISATTKMDLGIPGSSILLNVFPMAFGLALVPRRGAGLLMTAGAVTVSVLMYSLAVGSRGPGALTSLLATGPLLDLAVRKARGGLRLYTAIVLAGVGASLLAFLTRFAFRAGGVGALTRALAEGAWLSKATITYPICGAVAGLVSAVVWFRFRDRRAE